MSRERGERRIQLHILLLIQLLKHSFSGLLRSDSEGYTRVSLVGVLIS